MTIAGEYPVVQMGGILLAALLFLSLMGGAGVVTADTDSTSDDVCPGQENTKAYEKVTEDHPGFINSFDGRMNALVQSGCI